MRTTLHPRRASYARGYDAARSQGPWREALDAFYTTRAERRTLGKPLYILTAWKAGYYAATHKLGMRVLPATQRAPESWKPPAKQPRSRAGITYKRTLVPGAPRQARAPDRARAQPLRGYTKRLAMGLE